MKVYKTDSDGGWDELGEIRWRDGELASDIPDGTLQSILDRVNQTDTWNTAPPDEGSNASVKEGSEQIDEPRAWGLFRTLALGKGYGVAEESEILDRGNEGSGG